mmetsp:Transcript_11141/g.46368  ORF Transcript_11141/g.46368 Transcript_11141/m.46368 type:complete len:286 (-) Transcript_11141:360-1217(-)
MLRGTPTSSIEMLGSAVMTVRAEKSTRLPIRLPRMRPSLPLRRWQIDLMGRPERCVLTGTPGMVLSMYVITWYCTSLVYSARMCAGAPSSSCCFSLAFARTISLSLCVQSSSERPPSMATLGRTAGGGTGMAVITIQSGRANSGSRPSTRTSSSEMRRRISCTRSALSSILLSSGAITSESAPFLVLNSAMKVMPSCRVIFGCSALVASDTSMFWLACAMRVRRWKPFLILRAATMRRSGSLPSASFSARRRSLDVKKHTLRRTLSTIFTKCGWNTGLARSMWPK